MSTEQLQHSLQPFGGDQPDRAAVEKILDQYEEFVNFRRVGKAYRVGTRVFFLIVNCALFLAFGLLAVQQAGENSLPVKLALVSFMGVGSCFLWWNVVMMPYRLWKNTESADTCLRRGLQHEAIRMRWYWLLEKIPLHEDRPPEEVATTLPLAFITTHIVLGGFGTAMLV